MQSYKEQSLNKLFWDEMTILQRELQRELYQFHKEKKSSTSVTNKGIATVQM